RLPVVATIVKVAPLQHLAGRERDRVCVLNQSPQHPRATLGGLVEEDCPLFLAADPLRDEFGLFALNKLLTPPLQRVLQRDLPRRIRPKFRAREPKEKHVLGSGVREPNIFDPPWPGWIAVRQGPRRDDFAVLKINLEAWRVGSAPAVVYPKQCRGR